MKRKEVEEEEEEEEEAQLIISMFVLTTMKFSPQDLSRKSLHSMV